MIDPSDHRVLVGPDIGHRKAAAPAIIDQRGHFEFAPRRDAALARQQQRAQAIVPVGEDVGLDSHKVAGATFGREAPVIDARRDVFDNGAATAVGGSRRRHGACSSMIVASGGSDSVSEYCRPCEGSGAACTPPKLPCPLPPYTVASLFRTSRQKPSLGTPST